MKEWKGVLSFFLFLCCLESLDDVMKIGIFCVEVFLDETENKR